MGGNSWFDCVSECKNDKNSNGMLATYSKSTNRFLTYELFRTASEEDEFGMFFSADEDSKLAK